MKTPRQILLGSHQSAEPRLDAVREAALRSLRADADEPAETPNLVNPLNFILSLRWHLAGMSAAWLLIAFLNMEPSSSPSSDSRHYSSSHQLLLALQENRRQLLEWIDLSLAGPSSPARSSAPPRRSELQLATPIACV